MAMKNLTPIKMLTDNISKKCVECVYIGWQSFQEGHYNIAIEQFEHYFGLHALRTSQPGNVENPSPAVCHKINLIAHHYAAFAYAIRNDSPEDQKKAIETLKRLLRQLNPRTNLHDTVKTLSLMSKLHTNWGRVAQYRIKNKHELRMQLIRRFNLDTIEHEEFQMFKIGCIEI